MAKRPTRADVARAAGTSEAVVSYVVNNGPRPVAAATRQRVLEAMERLNYQPNRVAQALVSGKTGTYGLVLPNITNAFIAEIAHAIELTAFNNNKVIMVGDSADSHERELRLLSSMVSHNVDGIIYMGVTERLHAQFLKEAGIPTVVFTRADTDSIFDTVRVDETHEIHALTRHMLWHGFREVAMLSGPVNMKNTYWRADGWRQALTENGIDSDAQILGHAAYSRGAAYDWMEQQIRSGRVPRAVVTGNERQAVGLLAALSDSGLSAPDDVAVCAFNGTADSGYTTPALTSVRQPFTEMSKAVFEFLQQPSTAARVASFRGDLVIGRSCGCAGTLAQDRHTLASWGTPDPDNLDSSAGLLPPET